MNPAMAYFWRASKFLYKHKMTMMTSVLLIAGYQFHQYYLNQHQISEKVNDSAIWHVKDLLTRGPVNRVWCQYWVRNFKNDQVIDSLLYLLLTDIKTEGFK